MAGLASSKISWSFVCSRTDKWTLRESHKTLDTSNLSFSPPSQITIKEQGWQGMLKIAQ